MKARLILVFWVTLISMLSVYAETPRFFITTVASGDNVKASAYMSLFITEAFNELRKKFPCCEVNDIQSTLALLNWERQKQLLGSGSDENLKNIGDAMGCRYLISFQVTVWNGNSTFNVICMDAQKAKTLVRFGETVPYNGASLDVCIVLAKKLAKELAEYEICAYTGPVTIDVKGTRDETISSTSPSGCGSVQTTTTIAMNYTINWKLNKVGRNSAIGTASYNLFEKNTTITNYSCYVCKNGLECPMKFTDVSESNAKVEGLSNESVSEGNRVDDARIKIVFNEDGTYMLLVEATSKKGTLKETLEKKAEGGCQEEVKPTDTQNKKIDVPLKVTFGPYQGTPEDKILSQKETKDVSQGKDKTTVTIDFNLVRN